MSSVRSFWPLSLRILSFPKRAGKPAPKDDVQVIMTEDMARLFEDRCLGPNAELTEPLLFSDDDLPTYIIGLKPHQEN